MDDQQQVIRGLQQEVAKLRKEMVRLRKGVVTDDSPLSVALGGSDVPYTAKALAGLALAVDDPVAVLTRGNDLLVLGEIGGRKIALGTGSMNFPASATGTAVAVNHGLGAAPAVVLCMTLDNSSINHIVAYRWRSATTSTFTVDGRTVGGTAIGPGNVNFVWLAAA